MNTEQAIESIKKCLLARLVPFIQGSPGLGKSSIVKQVADEFGLELIDVRLAQCDPSDILGFPKLDGNKAEYLPMKMFPVQGDPLPINKKGWLLFLDEFNSAPKALQACAYKVVLDHMVGMHKLHDKVVIVCAGNKETDNAVTHKLSTALKSRLVNLELDVDKDAWLHWAQNNNIDYRISAYIDFMGNKGLYDFDPEVSNNTYACPRTWEMLNKLFAKNLIDDFDSVVSTSIIEGTIGAQTQQFISFINYSDKLPKMEDIIMGKDYVVPSEPGAKYLTVYGILAKADLVTSEEKANNLAKFLESLGKDFAVIFYLNVMKKAPKCATYKAIKNKVGEFISWLR